MVLTCMKMPLTSHKMVTPSLWFSPCFGIREVCANVVLRDWYSSTEEFSYFTLRGRQTPNTTDTSLFGIACSRQLDSKLLLNRPPDVTRSTVQKAVVVVTDSPQRVGQLREKLSVVTSAWFAQRYVGIGFCGLRFAWRTVSRADTEGWMSRDFSDIDILKVCMGPTTHENTTTG